MRILILLFFTILSAALNAAVFFVELNLPDGVNLHEKHYQEAFAFYLSARDKKVMREVKCDGGHCDILTDVYAIEIDRARKWYEAIGQALHYALCFNRKPAVAIFDAEKLPQKRREAMEWVCTHYNIDVIYLTRSRLN